MFETRLLLAAEHFSGMLQEHVQHIQHFSWKNELLFFHLERPYFCSFGALFGILNKRGYEGGSIFLCIDIGKSFPLAAVHKTIFKSTGNRYRPSGILLMNVLVCPECTFRCSDSLVRLPKGHFLFSGAFSSFLAWTNGRALSANAKAKTCAQYLGTFRQDMHGRVFVEIVI